MLIAPMEKGTPSSGGGSGLMVIFEIVEAVIRDVKTGT